MASVITLQEFINYLKPLITKRLNVFINSINEEQLTSSINADLEYKYHHNGNQNLETVANEILNKYKCKILSIRTLDNIFNTTLEEDLLDNEELLLQLTSIGSNKTVLEYIKHLIFNSTEVSNIIEPYFNTLLTVVNDAVEFINSQKYIEQKTAEWFAVRENMISASTCGHLDSKRCYKSDIGKEQEQIRKKAGIENKPFCGWATLPLRHGQQFEDLTGDIYDTTNNLVSREYGILTDEEHSHIGASPDGIIIEVKSDNFYSRLKYGRMREIKNPTSRAINSVIPGYYYYQMQQQMRVCKLPFCDFIQTRFKYPNQCTIEQFTADTMTKERLNECNNWSELTNLMSDYLLINLNYDILLSQFNEQLMNEPVNNLNSVFLRLLVDNWDTVSYFPLSNINKRGQLKGILWSFVKYNTNSDVDFRVEWLPIRQSYDSIISNIAEYEAELKSKYLPDGFILEETLYWSCTEYSVIEVEYNQVMYEDEVMPIIHDKWDLITKLKEYENDNDRDNEYLKHYPKCKKVKSKHNTLPKKPRFNLLAYA